MAAGTRAALRAAALIARAASEDVPVRNSFMIWWNITRNGVKSTVFVDATLCLGDSVNSLMSFQQRFAWPGNGKSAAVFSKEPSFSCRFASIHI